MSNKNPLMIDESQIFRTLDLLSFYISIYAAFYLCGNGFTGATLFIATLVCENFLRLYAHRKSMERRLLIPLFGFVVLTLVLSFLMPALYPSPNTGILAAVIVLLSIRSILTYHVIIWFHRDRNILFIQMLLVQFLISATIPLLLGLSVNWDLALNIGILMVIYPAAVLIWLFRSKNKKLVDEPDYSAGKISSFRRYNALLLSSGIALYLSMMTYTGILVMMPVQGDLLLPVILWVVLIITITVVIGRLFSWGRLKKFEKTSLFIAGGALWLFAYLQLNQSFTLLSLSLSWVWSLLQAAGIAVMMSMTTFMQEDMRLVLEIVEDDVERPLKTYRSLIQRAAFIIAGMLICAELFVLHLFAQGHFKDIPNSLRGQFMHILNLLPMIFVLLSMFFAIVQPLSNDIVRKLKLYREQKKTHTIAPLFEEHLKQILVKRYRKRIGVKIIAFLVKPFFYHKVIGANKVQSGAQPVIFVANHREIYGPVITNLYLPFSFRPWIEHNMIESKKILDYIWENTFSKLKPRWFARLALHVAGPVLVWVLNSVEPIPVYRGSMWDAIKSIRLSVTALQEEDNILIFPENPSASGGKYAESGVSPFYKGFVSIAKLYYKKAGRAALFVPVYADSKHRKITIGDGILYDPFGENEPDRISALLADAMNAMAEE